MTSRSTNVVRACLAALAMALAITAAARANDEHDHELARKALLEGRIRSLAEITEMVRPHLPGTILGVEIEVEDNGAIVYEFDVVDTDGKLKEVDVDATTGTILKIEDDD